MLGVLRFLDRREPLLVRLIASYIKLLETYIARFSSQSLWSFLVLFYVIHSLIYPMCGVCVEALFCQEGEGGWWLHYLLYNIINALLDWSCSCSLRKDAYAIAGLGY